MIGEPEEFPGELPGSTEPSGADDVVGDGDRSRAPGRLRRRRLWTGVLAGAVAASAVWVAALRADGWGQAAPPDLHGYRLVDDLCSSFHLEPLTDALHGGFDYNVPVVRRGRTVDRMTCDLTADSVSGDGWETQYHVTVSVDLHKKTDPRTEFADAYGPPAQPPPGLGDGEGPYEQYVYTHETVVKPYPGLGDLAYQTISPYHQGISVLRGGAVITMTVDATNAWRLGGKPPTDAHGAPERPYRVNTTGLRPVLTRTVGHLMTVLSH